MKDAAKSSEKVDPRMSCPLQRDKLVSEFCAVIPSTLDTLNLITRRTKNGFRRLVLCGLLVAMVAFRLLWSFTQSKPGGIEGNWYLSDLEGHK